MTGAEPYALALGLMLPPLLAVDFVLFGRNPHTILIREAIVWTVAWVAAAAGFALLIWRLAGGNDAELFVSVYVLERSLSLDNLLIFAALLTSNRIDPIMRQRVLTWAILLALVLRGVLLLAGYSLIQVTSAAHYIFGALLIVSGIVMVHRQIFDSSGTGHGLGEPDEIEEYTPTATISTRGIIALLGTIALADLMFALDSIPAAFAVTTDPSIVFSANIFAMLGLRALYFVLEPALRNLRYVQPALGVALAVIGIRMLLGDRLDVPHWAPAALTAALVAIGVIASNTHNNNQQKRLDDNNRG